ncbi:MAG: FAD-dependent thymidylate synthase [Selenomonadaceae bacterium]|nr:FAD-dependent thymidylate synthase [Selenomonadaceae bacterium]
MKIIEPSVELIDDIDGAQILRKLERCGKASRKSTLGDAESFVRSIIKRGHESVLEHVSLTFKIICDRAIMAELTRHRLASFTVESTRYVKYDDGLTVIGDPKLNKKQRYRWELGATSAVVAYQDLIELGCTPEIARAVLPLCLATELYMTANLREWRHILKLRTDKAAHPQMRVVAGQILNILREKLPVVVEDINP